MNLIIKTLSREKFDVALVVGKGEKFRLFVANDLGSVPQRVYSLRQKAVKMTPKAGTAKN